MYCSNILQRPKQTNRYFEVQSDAIWIVFQIWWQCSKAESGIPPFTFGKICHRRSRDQRLIETTSRSMISIEIKLMIPKKICFFSPATATYFFCSDMFIDIGCIIDHSAPSLNQPTQTSTHHGAVLWSIGWPGGWFASFSESLLPT